MNDPHREVDVMNNFRRTLAREVILPIFDEWRQQAESDGLLPPDLQNVRPEVHWEGGHSDE